MYSLEEHSTDQMPLVKLFANAKEIILNPILTELKCKSLRDKVTDLYSSLIRKKLVTETEK
jgi:hypothetical protein